MNINHIPACFDEYYKSEKEYDYNVLDFMDIKLNITSNRYNLPMELLFSMAARVNKRRRFLFVSNVLGKHVPVRNVNSLLIGALLAYKFLEDYGLQSHSVTMEIVNSLRKSEHGNLVWQKVISNPVKLKESVLFTSFAETATALGHSVFSCFDNARFIHTTREKIPDFENRILFEEEHSHATSHKVYPLDPNTLKSGSPIVFIDDEISTGKTVLNIIKEINNTYPRKEYIVLSILDFRSKEDRDYLEAFEKKEGIRVSFISLVSGEFEVGLNNKYKSWDEADTSLEASLHAQHKHLNKKWEKDIEVRYIRLDRFFADFIRMPSINDLGKANSTPYLKSTGRFGMDCSDSRKFHKELKKAAEFISGEIRGEKVLFLGTEEFIYIPLCISGFIKKDIYYHSTTRSPIYPDGSPDYPVKNAFRFACPPNPAVTNYVYNIPYGFYDEVYIFFERGFEKEGMNELLKAVYTWGIKKVNILTCSGKII